MKKIVLFASGNGSNAENIIVHFKNTNLGTVAAVFTNNEHAKVIERAKNQNVTTIIFNKNELNNGCVLKKLNDIKPDIIVLAGFLLMFPKSILEHYANVINIHPALLPKYGGKGMYGMNVHHAVLKNNEKASGITIHYVNEHYDEGEYIFQKEVTIENCTTADEIATKIHQLEQQYFPKVIEELLQNEF